MIWSCKDIMPFLKKLSKEERYREIVNDYTVINVVCDVGHPIVLWKN